jgi:hypothetical protein
MILEAGRTPKLRTTLYGDVAEHRKRALWRGAARAAGADVLALQHVAADSA